MEYELSLPACYSSTGLVFRIERFDCSAPLVVSPLVEPAGHRPQQTVTLGFETGVPGYMLLHPQPFFSDVYHPKFRPVSEAVGLYAGDARC
jgi:hypothetical protein